MKQGKYSEEQIVADLTLDNQALKAVVTKNF